MCITFGCSNWDEDTGAADRCSRCIRRRKREEAKKARALAEAGAEGRPATDGGQPRPARQPRPIPSDSIVTKSVTIPGLGITVSDTEALLLAGAVGVGAGFLLLGDGGSSLSGSSGKWDKFPTSSYQEFATAARRDGHDFEDIGPAWQEIKNE